MKKLLLLLSLTAATASLLPAQTTNLWIRNANTQSFWTNNAAWSPTNFPNGVDSVGIWGVTNSAARIITNLNTAITMGTLMFTNTNSFNWTITNGGTGTLTMDVSSGSAQLIVTNPGSSFGAPVGLTRVGPLTLADPLNIHHSGFTNLQIYGVSGAGAITATVLEEGNHGIVFVLSVNSTGGITKNGRGRLTVTTVANTFVGDLNLNAGELRVNGDGGLGDANNDLNFNGGLLRVQTNFTVPSTRVLTMQAGGGTIFNQTNGGPLILASAGQLAGAGALIKTNAGTLAVNAPNTGFTGPVFVNGGFLSLGDADGLGTMAAVTVNPGGIFLQTVGANAGNTFNIASNGVLSGPGSFMSSLTRGGNLIAGPGAIIASSDSGGNNLVNNLGTAGDLVYGIGGDVSDNITFGGGASPWVGLGNDGLNRTLFDSTITANGSFAMQSAVGVGADSFLNLGGTINISAASPINVDIPQGTVRLASPNANYANVTFVVFSNAVMNLLTNTAMGGSGIDDAGTKAPILVANGGRLQVGSTVDGLGLNTANAWNSSITVSNGGVLDLASKDGSDLSTGLTGSGTVSLAPLAIVRISGSNALTGTQLTPASLGAGRYVQLQVNHITSLNTMGSNLVYAINGASRTQNAGFFLSGGMITTDNATRNLGDGAGVITLGDNGGTLAAAVNFDTNGVRTVRILTNSETVVVGESGTGLLTIGSTAAASTFPDNRPRNGTVVLAGGFPSNNLLFLTGNLHFGDIHSNAFVAGTLITNVLVPDQSRAGFLMPRMTNTLDAGGSAVQQQVTITGGLDPLDQRNLFVSRTDASGTVRVDMTNIVLQAGAVLAVDEDNANVRASVVFEGAATLANTANSDQFDFVSLLSSVSGSPRTVLLGRTNLTDDFATPFLTGVVDDNFTLELINSGIRFSNSATLGANLVINNLGTNYVHPTAGQYRDGNPVFDNGRDGVGAPVGNNVTVNLGSGQDVSVVVDETDSLVTTTPLTNAFNGRVNIFTNQVGVLTATRGVDTTNVGTVVYNDVRLSPGATAMMAGANPSNILGDVTLDGDASIANNSGSNVRMMVDTVANSTFNVTIAGPNRINLLGSVSGAGAVAVTNGGRLGGIGTITGPLQVLAGGRLEPGLAGAGILTAGSAALGLDSTNIFEVNGNSPLTGYDQLVSAGAITLNGTLQATVVPTNFMPTPANSYPIISGGSRSGTFTNVADGGRIPAGASNGTFQVNYTLTQVILTNYQSRADLDGDGVSDTWAQTFFGTSPLSPAQLAGDTDGDGQSDLEEYVTGTDPLSAASAFRILTTYATNTTSVAVEWVHNTAGLNKGTAYTVQWTDDITTAYTNVVGPTITVPVSGTGQWIDDGTLTGGTAPLNLPKQRHYRIQAQ
jgi:autotransporter-associated beta strand protein